MVEWQQYKLSAKEEEIIVVAFFVYLLLFVCFWCSLVSYGLPIVTMEV